MTWDAADHLEDLGDVAAFLEVVFDEGGDNPAFIAKALGLRLHFESVWLTPRGFSAANVLASKKRTVLSRFGSSFDRYSGLA